MKVQIGVFYPDGKMYKGAEGETVGKAMVGPNAGQVIQNRRTIRGKMNEAGAKALALVQQLVNHKIKVVPKLIFSRYAGCGMCPCSPGYKIVIEVPDTAGQRIREEFQMFGTLAIGYYSKLRKEFIRESGVRDCGLSIWGEVAKNGRASIKGGHQTEQNERVFTEVKKILKENK